jgi:hypothetical protein
MAKRTNVEDLLDLLESGNGLDVIDPAAVAPPIALIPNDTWFRISTTYKTPHSAAASASIFRRKLGERARVRAVGQSVYVCYNAPEAARIAA